MSYDTWLEAPVQAAYERDDMANGLAEQLEGPLTCTHCDHEVAPSDVEVEVLDLHVWSERGYGGYEVTFGYVCPSCDDKVTWTDSDDNTDF